MKSKKLEIEIPEGKTAVCEHRRSACLQNVGTGSVLRSTIP